MSVTRCRLTFLVVGAAIWLSCAHVALAEDSPPLATPIPAGPSEVVDTGEGDPATLSLTLDTESTVLLDDLEPGTERAIPGAMSLTIAPGGGAWTVTCEVALGADHTSTAGIESLRLRLSEAVDWQTPGTVAIPCASGGNEGATLQFDLSVLVPEDATPGTFDLTVTFIVSAT